jgi:DNA-binding transcriptional MerR regulator
MSEKTYSISQVVEMLRNEFPDLTVSKIRFLESKGIIKPERKPSGYRLFTEKDVELLKKILILQRDHFMPLKVIKERLASGNLPDIRIDSRSAKGEPLKAEEVMKTYGISHDFLDDLEKFGLIESSIGPEGRLYEPEDVIIIELAVKLKAFGIEPRHLRVIENLVSKEALSFEQILFPIVRQKTDESLKQAKEMLDTLLSLSTEIHKVLIIKNLKKKFPEITF